MLDPDELIICKHCGKQHQPNYCEDCYQDLISENAKLQKDLHDFKIEHDIMKRILCQHGLWETLLNDKEFIKYLKEDYTG